MQEKRILTLVVLLLASVLLSGCNFFDWASGQYAASAEAERANAANALAQARIVEAQANAQAAALSAQAIAASSIHAETESSVRLMALLAVVNSQAGLGMSLTFLFGIFLCVVVVFVVSVRRSR